MSLCRCAQVSRAWNVLALDGSNWQKIDLFEFQTDVEVNMICLVVLRISVYKNIIFRVQ